MWRPRVRTMPCHAQPSVTATGRRFARRVPAGACRA